MRYTYKVKPLITDSLKSGQPPYSRLTCRPQLILVILKQPLRSGPLKADNLHTADMIVAHAD